VTKLRTQERLPHIPSEFLSVDLNLKSAADPAALVEAFGRRVLVQNLPQDRQRYWMVLILAEESPSPAAAISSFSKLVAGLPKNAREIWTQATKEFDIGVQAGLNLRSAEWVLGPEVVKAIAHMGAQVRFTVYSPLMLIQEGQQPQQKANDGATQSPSSKHPKRR